MDLGLLVTFLFALLGASLVVYLISVGSQAHHDTLIEGLRDFAVDLEEGQVTDGDAGTWFPSIGSAEVVGRIEGHDVYVAFRAGNDNGRTQIFATFRVEVSNPVEGYEVRQAGFLSWVSRWLGWSKDTQTGEERVDAKYLLRGEAESLKGLFQAREVERHFDRLFRRGVQVIELEPSSEDGLAWSTVECPCDGKLDPLELRATLDELVALASVSSRRSIQIKALGPGLQLAWTGGGDTALCPYCRDSIGDELEVSTCDRCRTVHHAECLTEAGGCTVYGCGGARLGQRDRAG